MARLTAPLFAPGPRKRLSDELHALHRRAGWPSVRELARALGSGVASSSRIHDAFTKPRLPVWGLVEVLVAELTSRIPSGPSTTEEVKRFHSYWEAAAADVNSSDSMPTVRDAMAAAKKGDYREAIRLTTASLTSPSRGLGPEHPDTLGCRYLMADWLGQAGDAAAAAAALSDLVEDSARVIGPEHPDTLACRFSRALWQGRAGKTTAAVMVLLDLVEDCKRVLGPDHPHTLDARHALAHWLAEAGDLDDAIADFDAVVQDRTRVLGSDHFHTLESRRQLLLLQQRKATGRGR